MTFLKKWFCNEKYTPMAQVIIAFVWGVALSPWSSGIFILIWSIILYELAYYIFTHGDPHFYNLSIRPAVISASVLGYIIGRTLSGDEILYEGVTDVRIEKLKWLSDYMKASNFQIE